MLFQDFEHAGFFHQVADPLSQISGCTYSFETPLLIHQRQIFRYINQINKLDKNATVLTSKINQQKFSVIMNSIPLPSHVHYEAILQLLEQKSQREAHQNRMTQEQLRQLILTLRKAFSQQKQLERSCDQLRIPYEYHWSLTAQNPEREAELVQQGNSIV